MESAFGGNGRLLSDGMPSSRSMHLSAKLGSMSSMAGGTSR
jgi:hypothetical protein